MELERARPELANLGLGICSISYDTVEILHAFADRRGINYPLLADPESAIIRRFGLLNETAAAGSRDEGMAHPGMLVVDASGVVQARFFEDRYYHRMTLPTVLARLGARAARTGAPTPRDHLDVRTGATALAVHPGNRLTLVVDVVPRPGVHVYSPAIGGGYQGLRLVVEPRPYLTIYVPRYPPGAVLTAAWTDEPLEGYLDRTRIEVDVALGTRQEMAGILAAGQDLHLTGALHVQACDDRVCWAPEVIPLTWHLDLVTPDLERAPEAIQHRPAS